MTIVTENYAMPGQPKFPHPLRRLRETIGFTQAEFARLLGVSKDAIQSIELWRMAMTEEMALKVRQQTGCVPFQTGVKKDEPPVIVRVRSFDSVKNYTKQDFVHHRKSMVGFAEQGFEHHAVAAARCINLLIYAAARRGGGYVLALCEDFERFAESAHNNYDLKSQVQAVVAEETLPYARRGIATNEIKGFLAAPLSIAYSFLLTTENRHDLKKAFG